MCNERPEDLPVVLPTRPKRSERRVGNEVLVPNSRAATENTLGAAGVKIVTPPLEGSEGFEFEVVGMGADGKRVKTDDPK